VRLARIAHPQHGVAFAEITPDETVKEILEHPFGTPEFSGRSWPLGEVRLLAPILPSKVVAFGRNYAAHARELGNEVPAEPMMFLKPSTSVIGPGAPIRLPAQSSSVSFEGELAVVIGRPCRDVRVGSGFVTGGVSLPASAVCMIASVIAPDLVHLHHGGPG